MASDDQKLKLVHLIRILEKETDDEHGLTGPQLIAALAERGVAVEQSCERRCANGTSRRLG